MTNGEYQVGSGRIVAVTHDNPFVNDSISQKESNSQEGKLQSKLSDRAVEHLQAENKYLKRLLRIQGQITHGKLFTRS